MSQENYTIIHAPKFMATLRAALVLADAGGQLGLALETFIEIQESLKRDPYELGESREEFSEDSIQIRIAFAASFILSYGIHEDTKNVFMRSITWYE